MKLFLIIILSMIAVIVLAEMLYIRFNGDNVPVPSIPRTLQTSGTGEPLTYVIMGDSTAASQGSNYNDGIAMASIRAIAKRHTVTALNTGISGATIQEVAAIQLPDAARLKPDIVLLSAGANDATHFTSIKTIAQSLDTIVTTLRSANPAVRIIVTGSPAMDSVPRFPIGAKQLMNLRTKQVNAVFDKAIKHYDLIHAPIAEKTRNAFLKDPSLTAADNFHPNARGYALWIPVINDAIGRAVTQYAAQTDR